jgi:hypothetical protein
MLRAQDEKSPRKEHGLSRATATESSFRHRRAPVAALTDHLVDPNDGAVAVDALTSVNLEYGVSDRGFYVRREDRVARLHSVSACLVTALLGPDLLRPFTRGSSGRS